MRASPPGKITKLEKKSIEFMSAAPGNYGNYYGARESPGKDIFSEVKK